MAGNGGDDAASLLSSSLSEKAHSNEESHKEHLRLAGIVKGVHADLRSKYKRCAGTVDWQS